MLSDAYATVEEYRETVGRISSDDDSAIGRDLVMASRWWDAHLRRAAGFNRSSEPAVRSYYVHRGPDGGGSHTLYVDDIADTNGLAIEACGESVESYELWPLNAPLESEPRPYDRIIRIGDGWPLGEKVTVTALWGWPAIPAAIRMATIEWAAVWRTESPRATQTVNELDQVQSLSPYHLSQMKRVADAYQLGRRPYVAAPA